MTAKDWCIANRQWQRKDNIQHAAHQHKTATTLEAKAFWLEVLALLK